MGSPFKYELLDLSNTHNAIADWLIANPGKGQMGRCAAVFGYSQSWLSTLIHQDAFQALLKHKQGAAFQEVVIPLHEKMAGVAHRGVERLGEILETSNDERLAREITKDMLNGLGYGANAKAPGGGTVINNNTQNNLFVDPAALAAARSRRTQHYGGNEIEGSSNPQGPAAETQTRELSSGPEPEMGPPRDIRPLDAHGQAPVHGEPEERGEVRSARSTVAE